jgi:hypothetical protein
MTTLSSLFSAGIVSDEAYDATTWSGVIGIAPSKDAVRDEFETKADKGINSDIISLTALSGDGIVSPKTSLADDALITLDTGKVGRGWAMAGDGEEYIEFRFTAAGAITIIANSANAINTDTDGNLCVYDLGAGIGIKNRLGATKTIRYIINYSA